MPILTWEDSYSIGVSKLDNQHKALILLINKAYDHADKHNDENEVLWRLAADMNAYALSHFTTEEELMEAYGFTEAEGHTAMHDEFKAKAKEYAAAAMVGTADPIETIKFLSDWLTGHIQGSDKKLGRFLNEQGIN